MNQVVWKFPIPPATRARGEWPMTTEVSVPRGARILDLQLQDGIACLWALVGQSEEYVTRKIVAVFTGQLGDLSGLDYLGTVQHYNGALVIHYFIAPEAP